MIESGRAMTYLELEEAIKQRAGHFHKKGIRKGDRILVLLPMSTELYIDVLAIFYMGAVAVFLDAWVNKKRMELCCRMAACKGLIASFKIRMIGLLSKEIRKIPIKLSPSKKGDGINAAPADVNDSDTALITFTTGSTGIPKAADRTHVFLKAQFDALQPLLPKHTGGDMTLLPIVLLLNLGTGKTSVIANFKASKPRSFDPPKIYDQLQHHRIESITFSPYYLMSLANYCLENKLKLPHLQNILSGGGPVFPHDASIIKLAFPHAAFTIVYGSTEAEPIAHIDSTELLRLTKQHIQTGLPVGKPDASARIQIIPIDEYPVKQVTALPAGSPGEIIVAGKHVLQSYINNEEAFKQNKIADNGVIWHRTGDAGYVNENGELFLLGRCKQIIHLGEQHYYPFLIEEELKRVPGIVAGTLILKNDQPHVIYQHEQIFDKETFLQQLERLQISAFRCVAIKQMPMDKRHHTKIDYEILNKMKI